MSIFLKQQSHSIRRGVNAVTATVVKLTSKVDSVELSDMAATSNTVVQLRRQGDPTVIVSQTDTDTVALTGNPGDEVLLISLHSDPTPQPR